MIDRLAGKSPAFNSQDFKFGTDFDHGDFTRTAPKRAHRRQAENSCLCPVIRNFSFSVGFIDGSGLNRSAST